MSDEIKKGLMGVVVDESAVSKVMPEHNALTYRGYDVRELCKKKTFLETAYLILHGQLPNAQQLKSFSDSEKNERELSSEALQVIKLCSKNAHPMDVIRTLISFLACEDSETMDNSKEANMRKAVRLLAKIPTIVAAFNRHRQGKHFIAPSKTDDYVTNFFNTCLEVTPSAVVQKAFDASLILYSEHGFNASTFTTRVVVSSLSDLHGAVCAGVASLKGPLHGGANEAVMRMMLEIDSSSEADSWLVDALAKKKKVMGFGHRVYKGGDSRVPTMKEHFLAVAKDSNNTKYPEMYEALEKAMIREKNIHPNLDFPAGPTYYLMGFEIDFFTPLFVMARITGWSAHIIEQLENNRLIRPLSAYNGEGFRTIS